jgi:hypothetical protein
MRRWHWSPPWRDSPRSRRRSIASADGLPRPHHRIGDDPVAQIRGVGAISHDRSNPVPERHVGDARYWRRAGTWRPRGPYPALRSAEVRGPWLTCQSRRGPSVPRAVVRSWTLRSLRSRQNPTVVVRAVLLLLSGISNARRQVGWRVGAVSMIFHGSRRRGDAA